MVGGAFVQIDFLPKPLVLATNSHFQNMKKKIALILMFLLLAGCQSKSEIDKCVDALALQTCSGVPETRWKENPEYDRSDCIKEVNVSLSADFRLQCLKAQAGKE
jgi:hypothetical protein